MFRAWLTSRFGGARLLGSIIVIWGVITLTFLLARLVSPDPVELYVTADASQEDRDRVRQELGLDAPLWTQYGTFLLQLLRGDLGTSFNTGQPVAQDLMQRLPATAELALWAIVGGLIIGLIAGMVSAVRAGTWIDAVIRVLTVAGLSLPTFWIGLVLLWIFFLQLGIAPGPIGRLPIGESPPPAVTGLYVPDAIIAGDWRLAADAASQLVLPAFTLGIGVFAPIARVMRTAMIGVLQTDYIRTATAMGIPRRRIWFVYGLKNGLLPVITMFAGVVGYALAGAVLTEGIFGWPGIGQYALNAVQRADFPAVQGFVIYTSVLYVVIYLLLDFVYLIVDPRVRS